MRDLRGRRARVASLSLILFHKQFESRPLPVAAPEPRARETFVQSASRDDMCTYRLLRGRIARLELPLLVSSRRAELNSCSDTCAVAADSASIGRKARPMGS